MDECNPHLHGGLRFAAAVRYGELAQVFDQLESVSSRLETTRLLANLLRKVQPDETVATMRLLRGQVAPDWEGLELGLADKTMIKTLATISGRSDVQKLYHEIGDLGRTAEQLLAAGGKQVSLFGAEPLTVAAVYEKLLEIARTAGSGSQELKQKLLNRLLSDAEPIEGRYLIRTVSGRLRLGVADMTVLDALAAVATGREVMSVQDMTPEDRAEHEETRHRLERAFDVRSDLAVVAQALINDGMDGVDKLGIEHGIPLRPMAAERLKTVAEILEKHGGRTAVETKYDGLRLQCHVTKDDVRIYSRRLEDLTAQFPDVQQMLKGALKVDSCIVEGECVAIDLETGRMRPFQDISRRRGRKSGLGEDARQETALSAGGEAATTVMDEVPVAVYLFDVMAVNGNSVMHKAYEERRNELSSCLELSRRVALSSMEICTDEGALEAFFQTVVQEGGEGIMCKNLAGIYKAGNRGYDWIKFKADYTAELVDTMDLVAIGAFHGRGRRGGWYGAVLMGARDEETGNIVSVCKLGTGFDDATLQSLAGKFAEVVIPAKDDNVDSTMVPDVWFSPKYVMEVQAAELTLSPTHRAAWGQLRPDAGLAARFPRFTGWRDDKGVDQATTTAELVAMYEAQAMQSK